MTQEVTTAGSRRTSTHRSRAGCGLDLGDERKTHETSSYRCVRWWKVNVPTGYVRLGRRVVNPKAVYGSQRGRALALYRRIYGRAAPPAKPVTFR